MIITLQGPDGSQITNATVPDSAGKPNTVLWGKRVFLLHSAGDGDTRAVFRETPVTEVVTSGKD